MKEDKANFLVALARVDGVFVFVRIKTSYYLWLSSRVLGDQGREGLFIVENALKIRTRSTLDPEHLDLVFMATASSEILGVKTM